MYLSVVGVEDSIERVLRPRYNLQSRFAQINLQMMLILINMLR